MDDTSFRLIFKNSGHSNLTLSPKTLTKLTSRAKSNLSGGKNEPLDSDSILKYKQLKKFFPSFKKYRIKDTRQERARLKPLLDSLIHSKSIIGNILKTRSINVKERESNSKSLLSDVKISYHSKSLYKQIRGRTVDVKSKKIKRRSPVKNEMRTSMEIDTSSIKSKIFARKKRILDMRKHSRKGIGSSYNPSNKSDKKRGFKINNSRSKIQGSVKKAGSFKYTRDKKKKGKRKAKKKRDPRFLNKKNELDTGNYIEKMVSRMKYVNLAQRYFEEVTILKKIKPIDNLKNILIIEASNILIAKAYNRQQEKIDCYYFSKSFSKILGRLSKHANIFVLIPDKIPNFIKSFLITKLEGGKVNGFLGAKMEKMLDYSDVAYRLNFRNENKIIVLKPFECDVVNGDISEKFLSRNSEFFSKLQDMIPARTIFPKYTVLMRTFLLDLSTKNKPVENYIIEVETPLDEFASGLVSILSNSMLKPVSGGRKFTYGEVVSLENKFIKNRILELRRLHKVNNDSFRFSLKGLKSKGENEEKKDFVNSIKKDLGVKNSLSSDSDSLKQLGVLAMKNISNYLQIIKNPDTVKPHYNTELTKHFMKKKDEMFKQYSQQLRATIILLLGESAD